MRYSIISINDDRAEYKKVIRDRVPFEEVFVPAFNAYQESPTIGLSHRNLVLRGWGNAKKGEVGVWISNYDNWKFVSESDEPLIVFEDDAIPNEYFKWKFTAAVRELPDDWDFMALWVPDNQRLDYLYDVQYNENGHPRHSGVLPPSESKFRIEGNEIVSRVYQGYGMVALMYSPLGGKKLIDLAHSRGLDTPVDCWLYEEAHKGNLNGYAPKPDFADLVGYDWSTPTHVQNTERLI